MFDDKLGAKLNSAVDRFVSEMDNRLANIPSVADIQDIKESLSTQRQETNSQSARMSVYEQRLERLERKDKKRNLFFSNVTCKGQYFKCSHSNNE